MKTSGIVRNLDNVGRLVIPKEIRNVMGINEGDPLEIVKVNNEIVVRKYSRGCIFCGSDKNASEFNDMIVCKVCKKALKEE
ncbi:MULTISPECIES: AbrB/MazE/SpoVT family DNA-binding domain-containing protein [Clostridium]|jgi:transcriptional pleiotropic regulator of transition state genes|uniref:AbrB/MazE/SpoVT family DNA-binding domain-containing protein n=2 Tax=Clostridium TaxID=1485 RepID=A0A512TNG3_CLOBU|nr:MULTISPECIES: AbrB/MazE/SpoVT family DNA-binding domain-containing protein [Clostridium]NAS17508.1 AbrB/MazE/SpoVT family DNA-binding domain-containing protein [Clostridium butyricum]NOW22697.1 transcriptional pleiotropic regulator of transition state genes [Clostridium butyricum]OOP74274.1 AbrB family transcriptional regulator [Clostridium beijerinckii]GEQ21767.1 SpoVT/AbrB family regulatory protein [Clostridium butyricum]